jgi:hypothetical protein
MDILGVVEDKLLTLLQIGLPLQLKLLLWFSYGSELRPMSLLDLIGQPSFHVCTSQTAAAVPFETLAVTLLGEAELSILACRPA